MMEGSDTAPSVPLDIITILHHPWEPPGGQDSAPPHPRPAGAHSAWLSKAARGGVENVNIRLARWEIAHSSNHKHPHVSLQHKGVLGEWGGAEAGGISDQVTSAPAGAPGSGLRDSSASEALASLGSCRQRQPLIRGVRNGSCGP